MGASYGEVSVHSCAHVLIADIYHGNSQRAIYNDYARLHNYGKMTSASRIKTGPDGGMAERPKAHVLKTCLGHTNVGSNPTPSARQIFDFRLLHLRAVQVLTILD